MKIQKCMHCGEETRFVTISELPKRIIKMKNGESFYVQSASDRAAALQIAKTLNRSGDLKLKIISRNGSFIVAAIAV